ncbi:MAG: hypothetical protein PHE68_01290 [Candidatus Peribacteraceae bacterium]|nr:hypothetical protein [Candidatus Peribacteraceae bacterium]MDD5074578.1 hypothetical protein [Candidatus Peribacteraceae bacterium]
MKKIGRQKAHIFRGDETPPPDGALLRTLNQAAFGKLDPFLQRVIRERIGDALGMQTAIESYLGGLHPSERDNMRRRVYRVFNVHERDCIQPHESAPSIGCCAENSAQAFATSLCNTPQVSPTD